METVREFHCTLHFTMIQRTDTPYKCNTVWTSWEVTPCMPSPIHDLQLLSYQRFRKDIVFTFKYMKLSTGRKKILLRASPRSFNECSYDNILLASAGDIDSISKRRSLLIAKCLAVRLALQNNAPGRPQAGELIAILCDGAFDLEVICTCIHCIEDCGVIMKQMVEKLLTWGMFRPQSMKSS